MWFYSNKSRRRGRLHTDEPTPVTVAALYWLPTTTQSKQELWSAPEHRFRRNDMDSDTVADLRADCLDGSHQLLDTVDVDRIRGVATRFQFGVDDRTVGHCQQAVDRVGGDTTTDEKRRRAFVVGGAAATSSRVSTAAPVPGTADDHSIGQSSLDEIDNSIGDPSAASDTACLTSTAAESSSRHRVVHGVVPSRGLASRSRPIGDGRPDTEVDPDELGLEGRHNRERSRGVVPQDDADGAVDGAAHGSSDPCHRRHSVFRDALGGKRNVTVVLAQQAVDAVCDQSLASLTAASRRLQTHLWPLERPAADRDVLAGYRTGVSLPTTWAFVAYIPRSTGGDGAPNGGTPTRKSYIAIPKSVGGRERNAAII